MPLKTVEVWRNNAWVVVRLMDVKQGEAFHVFNNEFDPDRLKVWYAMSDAYFASYRSNPSDYRWTINAQPAIQE